MKKIKNLLLLVIILCVMVMFFFMFYNGKLSSLPSSPQISDDALITQGQYLARVGDCAACHSAGNGQFAGGLALDSGTPVGIIYSTNITPDKGSGIGDYSLRDFDNAVRHGVRRDGASLYPAMPYPSFATVKDEDIAALYAYIMSIKPVQYENKPVSGGWPFTMRWPVNAWRLLFAPSVHPFVASSNSSDEVARGAYLVQGLGHCGTCHTPRDMVMAEKSYNANNNSTFLAGAAPLEGWNAMSLRGDDINGLGSISQEQLFLLLKTGQNDHSAVFGSMTEVVEKSLQYLSDNDLSAMVAYLKTLPPVSAKNPPFTYDTSTYNAFYNGSDGRTGAETYMNHCAACHRTNGKGDARVFPALAGNPTVQSIDASSIISLVLRGGTTAHTQSDPTTFTMPGYAWRLSDDDVASVTNFIRTSWGNNEKLTTPHEVRQLRQFVTEEMMTEQAMQTNPISKFDELN